MLLCWQRHYWRVPAAAQPGSDGSAGTRKRLLGAVWEPLVTGFTPRGWRVCAGLLIAHCDVAAWDLLLPYGDVVMTLFIVLRIKRTLDGAEIDKIISDVQARKGLAIEHVRRKRWQQAIENAAAFDHG
jgi:hypothetical protein